VGMTNAQPTSAIQLKAPATAEHVLAALGKI